MTHGAAKILRVGLRVLGAVLGGYALAALLVAVAGALLVRLGTARAEAVVAAAMLGFLAYLAVLLWGFSVHSVRRLWAVVAIGAAVMGGLLWIVR